MAFSRAGLCRPRGARSFFGLDSERDELALVAKAAFDRARSLTPDSPHVLLNEAQRDANRGALREAGAVYERLPSLVAEYGDTGYFTFETGLFLARVGRIEEATSILERTRRIEPLSGVVAAFLGDLYAAKGKFAEALAEYDRGLRLKADAMEMLRVVALRVALATRDRAEIERRLDAIGRDQSSAMNRRLGRFLDNAAEGLAEIRSIEATALAEDPIVLARLALWAAYYGDPEHSLSLLKRLRASGGSGGVLWVSMWAPAMRDVRKLPGFNEFARDLGLVDYWREYGWADLCRPVGRDDFECD